MEWSPMPCITEHLLFTWLSWGLPSPLHPCPSSDRGTEEGRGQADGVCGGGLADPSVPSPKNCPAGRGLGWGWGRPGLEVAAAARGQGKARLCEGFLPATQLLLSEAAEAVRKAKAGKGYGNSVPATKSGRDRRLRPSAG